MHGCEPRPERNPRMLDSQNMAYRSVYWEQGKEDPTGVLRESGFRRFRTFNINTR
jgi:hypothetical protein